MKYFDFCQQKLFLEVKMSIFVAQFNLGLETNCKNINIP